MRGFNFNFKVKYYTKHGKLLSFIKWNLIIVMLLVNLRTWLLWKICIALGSYYATVPDRFIFLHQYCPTFSLEFHDHTLQTSNEAERRQFSSNSCIVYVNSCRKLPTISGLFLPIEQLT